MRSRSRMGWYLSLLATFVAYASLGVLGTTTHAAINEEDVVLYWSFDRDTGDDIPDLSNYGNDGMIVGNANWVDGQFGQGLELQTGAHIETSTANGVSMTYMSQALWFKSTTLSSTENQFGFISNGLGGVASRVFYFSTWCSAGPPHNCVHLGTLDLAGGWGRGLATPKLFDEDEWYFIAGVIDNETGVHDVYVDGVKVFTQQHATGDTPTEATTIWVGAATEGGRPLTGVIDEVAFFNIALTEEDVRSLMENGLNQTLAVNSVGKVATTWARIKTR